MFVLEFDWNTASLKLVMLQPGYGWETFLDELGSLEGQPWAMWSTARAIVNQRPDRQFGRPDERAWAWFPGFYAGRNVCQQIKVAYFAMSLSDFKARTLTLLYAGLADGP